jgi:hypothetical protein
MILKRPERLEEWVGIRLVSSEWLDQCVFDCEGLAGRITAQGINILFRGVVIWPGLDHIRPADAAIVKPEPEANPVFIAVPLHWP